MSDLCDVTLIKFNNTTAATTADADATAAITAITGGVANSTTVHNKI
jgi:hypothetical protein